VITGKVKNIDLISNEKILVFGGVYSNLQALEAIRKVAIDQKIQNHQIICTGDILGYCAQPNECIELIQEWGIESIAGNVELQIRNDEESCGCNFSEGSRCDVFSQNWYQYIRDHISLENKEWLNTLPEFLKFNWGTHKAFVLHGGLEDTSQFVFKSTAWRVKQAILDKVDADIILAGHCGLPFKSKKDNRYWVNSGVIGMPANDGTPRVWYMILESKNDQVEISYKSLDYDYHTAHRLMLDNNLPSTYASTLISGLWDNMEILNEPEKNLQGLRLSFDQ